MANSKQIGIASIIVVIAITGISLAIGLLSDRYLPDDNFLEEASEEEIKQQTGADIDLTPRSPEKR